MRKISRVVGLGLALTLGLLCSCAAVAAGGEEGARPLLLRQPTINATDIVFVYGDDLWRVSRQGGQAVRLTADPAIKGWPHLSPDGQTIAFTGEYDGKPNVYVMPVTGGSPRRVTFHPGPDIVAGWTPDGKKILFTSPRDSFAAGASALYTVPVQGGFVQRLPLPMGWDGSYSADGQYLAYRPGGLPWGNWSHYRGGTSPRIWIAKLADSSITELPHKDWNDLYPMWVGDTIYFLSDRNGPYTLFAYNTRTKAETQLVENHGFPLKWAEAGPGAIVYEQFGAIHLFDLQTHEDQAVKIEVAADLLEPRGHFEKVAGQISAFGISPTGVRAVFEAHGEILTVPAEKGDIRNLTHSPGVADRDPAWSPNGKWIAYFSDESGEYAMHLCGQSGMGETRKISLGNPPSYFYGPTWSPDSKKIAYTDKRLNLWYVDLDKPVPVKVDTDYYSSHATSLNPAWSPDSRWIVYAKLLPSHLRAVHVYSLETRKATQITDGMSDAEYAAFDGSGKYIYFTASTNIGPAVEGMDMSSDGREVTRSVYLAVLRKDLPSPLAPESDEEKVTEDNAAGGGEGAAEEGQGADGGKPAATTSPTTAPPTAPAPPETQAATGSAPPVTQPAGTGKGEADHEKEGGMGKGKRGSGPKVTIDFANLSQRIVALPLPARNYIGLDARQPGEIFLAAYPQDVDFTEGPPGFTLYKFDLNKRKEVELSDGIEDATIASNGEKYLYHQGDVWGIASTLMPARPGEGALRTAGMEVWVEPRAEWAQMFREIWRIERDFFYDPHLHGVNIAALAKEYEPYLAGIATRSDLNYLFAQMLSEINVGHMFVGGGVIPKPRPLQVGLLGADYAVENGHYRFARILQGENWNPKLRAPLTQPGVNVGAGEYLLAVNGVEARPDQDVYTYFQELAGKQTILKVGPKPDGTGAREVTVVPEPSEMALRNRTWMEDNLRRVEKLSAGQLAYVYLPNTGGAGFTNFNRYFFAQVGRRGLLVDERFNEGGQAPDYIIQYMQRKIWNYWLTREGAISTAPQGGIFGPKAMLINEFAGSGGDLLPWYFRHTGLGPLIGKRTWGGLVGIGGYPPLIDGGFVTAPHIAFFTTDGKWDVENHGVGPDVEVELDPAAWRKGHDTQLEKGVAVLMAELAKEPAVKVKVPAYPDYAKYSTGK